MPPNSDSADRISLSRKGEEDKFDNALGREVIQILLEASDGKFYIVSGQNPADYEDVDYEVLAFPMDDSGKNPVTNEPIVGGHTHDECIHFLELWLNGSGDRGWAPTPIQKLSWLAKDKGDDAALDEVKNDEEFMKGILAQLFGNIVSGREAGRPDLMLMGMLPIMELLGFDFATMPPELRAAIEKMGVDLD